MNRFLLASAMLIWAASCGYAQPKGQPKKGTPEDEFYPILRFEPPKGQVLEGGAIEMMPDGKVAVGTRRGEIWIIDYALESDPKNARFTRFAHGLHEILGLAQKDGWLYVTQRPDVSRTREDRIRTDGKEERRENYVAEHPIVRTHPESGRKSLYVNVAHTSGIKGLTDEESAPILEFLFKHQVKPEFTCRFVWTPNAIAFWDNRAAMHNPVNDYHGFRRVMQRITLKGDRPR